MLVLQVVAIVPRNSLLSFDGTIVVAVVRYFVVNAALRF